jgi:hypothetical protein
MKETESARKKRNRQNRLEFYREGERTRRKRAIEKNPNIYKAQRKRRTLKIRQYIWSYKAHNPCVDCGETDPVVLEFDHRNSSTKEMALGAVDGGISLQKIIDEIEKCDIRCANCHRRRTALARGWMRHQS